MNPVLHGRTLPGKAARLLHRAIRGPNLTGPKNQPPDSPSLAREKIRSLSRLRGLNVLPLTLESVHHALDLCVAGDITRQSYFDRQLAALMLREGIPVILTENTKDFSGIEGITPVNPFA